MPYEFNVNRRFNPQFGLGTPYSGGGGKRPMISEVVLNAIPGFLAWLALFMVIGLAIKIPLVMIFLATILSVYTSTRFFFAGMALVLGLRYVRQWEAKDWAAEYQERYRPGHLALEDVHHLVILPNYKEEVATLRWSLAQLAIQKNAQTQVSIVLAMEAGEEEAALKGELLRGEFGPCFANFLVAMHPKGLHQEMQCKSANEAWAAREAKQHLVDELGLPIQHIVVTTMDADTLWHPNYLEALTVLFATDDSRHSVFWQAPIRYHSNVWDINPFMRMVHAYSTGWELAYLAAPWWPALPMSSYSLSLKLLDIAGYWDADVIADEWHMYIKAYFVRDGDMALRPIFLPFLGSATGGTSLLDSFKQRYQQTLRHAWGAKEIGYTIAQIQNNPQIERHKSYHLLFRVAHDNLLAGVGGVILTAGVQLPSLLHPGSIGQWTQTPIFYALQVSFLVVTLITLLFWRVDVITRPPRHTTMTPTERVMAALSIPALPLVSLLVVALPVLHSQTRLMLSLPLQFRVTRKFISS